MTFEVRQVTGPEITDQNSLSFSGDHVIGADFSRRRLRYFTSAASRFEGCNFRGTVLAVMERNVTDGQTQLLVRADDYPRHARPAIRALLDAARRT